MICRGIQIQEKQYIGENSVPTKTVYYFVKRWEVVFAEICNCRC